MLLLQLNSSKSERGGKIAILLERKHLMEFPMAFANIGWPNGKWYTFISVDST